MHRLILLFAVSAVSAQTGTITIDVLKPVNTFDPGVALGAGIDGHERGEVAKMLSSTNVAAMRSAGLKSLSYRLRSELAGEAWHWNPEGTWSDPAHQQGYWTSSATSSKPIEVSYGYRLPRRGNTIDQANNDGYSMLADGSLDTFWKSNPYLDQHFTAEPNSAHPQWVLIDFGRPIPIDTVRVVWGIPRATEFHYEYSSVTKDMDPTTEDAWQLLPSDTRVSTRYLRLVMTAFSGTAPQGSTDIRDGLGVAIKEIYAGITGRQGFRDAVRHSPGHNQTVIHVSSTDPWHRATDLDPRIQQPGFDLLARLSLTNSQPMLIAVPLLYDIPENAPTQIAYLKSHGIAVTHAELGEEPEEQGILPRDYGALYVQWARRLPGLQIGGPSLVLLHADATPDPSWTKRLFLWLHDHNAHLDFFSFEWYPFDEVCDPVAPQLAASAELFAASLERLHADGVPATLPLFLTEYGYSAFGTEAEVTLPGAILNAEVAAQFLTLGGAQTYLYGYEPNELIREGHCSYGNNMLFVMDDDGNIAGRTATYHAARLVTQEWAAPAGGPHRLYRAESKIPLVTAFALLRPDGQWSVLLLNKSPTQVQTVGIPLFRGPVDLFQYSPAQYQWKAARDQGHPIRELPPAQSRGNADSLLLPAYSITVVRGYAK